jgi:hypothetical protein
MLTSQNPWHRTHDDPSIAAIPNPSVRYYPTSLDDVIDIVQHAKTMSTSPEVRACGSHWALSTAAMTNDFLVETQDPEGDRSDPNRPRLNKTLYPVIHDCMTADALGFFIGQGVTPFDPMLPPDHSKFYLYHVEAGTRIYELCCRLDAGDADPMSLASLLARQGHPEYEGPWAMPTLGGAGGQTIVGAFSTGTHGGDIRLPPIADAVQAVHLIGPQGLQFWIERPLGGPGGAPLVVASKLQTLYGRPGSPITVLRDLDILNSVIVAAGRLGIIYSVVLRVVRQYALEENGSQDTWSNVKAWVNNPQHPNFTNNRFASVVVNPNGQVGNTAEHTCWVTFRTLQPLIVAGVPPFGREERCAPDNLGNSTPLGTTDPTSFFNLMCESDSPLKEGLTECIQQLENVGDGLAKVAAILAFLDPAAAGSALTGALTAYSLADGVLTLLGSIPDGRPLCDTLAAVANWAADNNRFDVIQYVSDALIGQERTPLAHPGISYAVMDRHNYLDRGCEASGDSVEVFLDASSPRLLTFMDQLFQRLTELQNGSLAGRPAAFTGYISLRFTSNSAALIGMQQFPATCAIEIAGCRGTYGFDSFMTQLQRDAVALGGTVHWGQRNDLTMPEVEKEFSPIGPSGALFRWRKALSTLSNNGRFPMFSTEFTRLRGLEVVQPVLESFAVNPTHGCAGSPVHVTWTASDNPLETVATLEIQPSGAPGTIIQLGVLEGWQDVILPLGSTDLTLQVALTVNGRTLIDGSTTQVQGFPTKDTRILDQTATCLHIDGLHRWGVEATFTPGTAPTELTVEELDCVFPLATEWYVRKAGMPDVTFSSLAQQHSFTVQPELQGTWTFFLKTGFPFGCPGTAPKLLAKFTVTCS